MLIPNGTANQFMDWIKTVNNQHNMNKLVQPYVNLYRILWNGNAGLWTEDLERMSEAELRKGIKEMKQEIYGKDKNCDKIPTYASDTY